MSLAPRIDRLEKNYLMNGGLDFFQRSTAAVNLTTTLSYLNADRFRFSYTGTVTGTPQVQRSTDVPNYLTRYSQQFISRRNASSLSLNCSHRIEGANVRELAGSNFSVSLQVKSAVATVVRLRISIPSAEDNYTSTTEIYNTTKSLVADSTWRLISFESITAPVTSINGMQVDISLEMSSGTDAANTNHFISQIMLNGGITAANFARAGRNIADELNMCQRYYEKSFNIDTTPIVNISVFNQVSMYDTNGSGGQRSNLVNFSVSKRSLPVVVTYNPFGSTLNTVHREPSGASGANYAVTNEASIIGFRLYSVSSGAGQYLFDWTADAEL